MSPLLWRLGSQAGCLCHFASVGAAEVAGEDAEGFAVFGDGAAGDADTAFGEEACDVFVAEGAGAVFGADEFCEGGFDASVGALFAVVGGEAGGEEVAHFADALRGGHVFTGDGAADGGFVDTDGIGDGGHVERAESGGAESHEVLLTFDDFFGDALDGLLALVDAADEEFAGADFVADVAADVVAFAGFGHDVLVEIADAEAWELAFVHGDGVAAGLPFDVDVRGDELAR